MDGGLGATSTHFIESSREEYQSNDKPSVSSGRWLEARRKRIRSLIRTGKTLTFPEYGREKKRAVPI